MDYDYVEKLVEGYPPKNFQNHYKMSIVKSSVDSLLDTMKKDLQAMERDDSYRPTNNESNDDIITVNDVEYSIPYITVWGEYGRYGNEHPDRIYDIIQKLENLTNNMF